MWEKIAQIFLHNFSVLIWTGKFNISCAAFRCKVFWFQIVFLQFIYIQAHAWPKGTGLTNACSKIISCGFKKHVIKYLIHFSIIEIVFYKLIHLKYMYMYYFFFTEASSIFIAFLTKTVCSPCLNTFSGCKACRLCDVSVFQEALVSRAA